MAYPGVMAVVAIGVTIFLLTFVLPKFTPLFEPQRRQAAGPPTIVMMRVSDAMIDYWYVWLASIVASVVVVRLTVERTAARPAGDATGAKFTPAAAGRVCSAK